MIQSSCKLIVIFVIYIATLGALGNAETLALISHVGNQYRYSLQVDLSHGWVPTGDQITLTGLAGVTDAKILLDDRIFTFTPPIITPTSVTFTITNSPVFDPVFFTASVPLISITSPMLPAGSQYQIMTNNGHISGSLPVANPIRLSVWRPGDSTWYINPINGTPFTRQMGVEEDIPVDADFDQDGVPDFAVWRPSEGMWSIERSDGSSLSDFQWGLPGDVPVPGDYDGDGRPDYAVWRPSNGSWYIFSSNALVPNNPTIKQWGLTFDIPVVADFDGDGKVDFAVWRPTEGNWYITFSSTGATTVQQWGLPGDLPVAADFDGDGKADYAVWRQSLGNWYIIPSSTGVPYVVQWGLPGDIPVPRTYDGDAKADLAVWRPSNGTWYIIPSATPGTPLIVQWGLPGDVPVYAPPALLTPRTPLQH